MEQLLGEVRLSYSDSLVNTALESLAAAGVEFSRHFTQTEDFFVKLARPFTIPSLPIHHDVRDARPSEHYLAAIRKLVPVVAGLVPGFFAGLTYFFDPGETLKPAFYQLYQLGDALFLFLLRLDLQFRPNLHQAAAAGSNDKTPEYTTDKLFLEADLIPIREVIAREGRTTGFVFRQYVSQTWIGETGRGVFRQGIWLDRELTKFFSKLFIPAGRRFYPYYPFNCKYRSFCMSVIDLDHEKRRNQLAFLRQAIDFIEPVLPDIEQALRGNDFSEGMEAFKLLKSRVPPQWATIWGGLSVRPYINERDMKEFAVEE